MGIAANRRIYFLDNLRTVIIFWVVVFHVGGVYESYGDWESFWLVDDADTSELSGFINIVLDIFSMPVLFFISGYLTPTSLKRKGGLAFVSSKLRRLMIPWLIAVITLIPLYKIIFLYSRDLPQTSWTSYFYLSNHIVGVGMAWLWFLPVLFIFTLLYAGLAYLDWVPTRLSLYKAIGIVVVISLFSSLCFDLADALGWFHTPLVDFQKERVLMYFLVFLLGTLAYHRQIFAAPPKLDTLYRIVKYTLWLPLVLYFVFLVRRSSMEDDGLSISLSDQLGYWIGFYLSLASILYWIIVYCWRHFDTTGKFWVVLNRNSYNVYLIHVIVLGVLALPLLHIALPGVLKYLILTGSTYVICNLLVLLYRQTNQMRRASSGKK